MANSFDSDPPPYTATSNTSGESANAPVGLKCLTILPQVIGQHPTSKRAECEPFSVLVEKANEVLRREPHFVVRSCETVEFAADSKGTISDDTSVNVYHGENANRRVRGLRLWLQERCPDQPSKNQYDQIGHFSFMPRLDKDVELVERLDSLALRVNTLFMEKHVPGRIITVETLSVKWGSRKIDPDVTIWTERGSASSTFVQFLRVFYIYGVPRREQICWVDFVPEMLQIGGPLGKPVMETFSTVISRVEKWLSTVPPNHRPANVQTILFRWAFKKEVDPLCMTYTEKKLHLDYVRFLRVVYVVEAARASVSRSTIQLGSQLFIPETYRKPGIFQRGSFETQQSVQLRIHQWASKTRARIVSIETLHMRIRGGGERIAGFNTMYTWNNVVSAISGGDRTYRADEEFCTLYRVYTDGHYPDDPETETRTRAAMADIQRRPTLADQILCTGLCVIV